MISGFQGLPLQLWAEKAGVPGFIIRFNVMRFLI